MPLSMEWVPAPLRVPAHCCQLSLWLHRGRSGYWQEAGGCPSLLCHKPPGSGLAPRLRRGSSSTGRPPHSHCPPLCTLTICRQQNACEGEARHRRLGGEHQEAGEAR